MGCLQSQEHRFFEPGYGLAQWTGQMFIQPWAIAVAQRLSLGIPQAILLHFQKSPSDEDGPSEWPVEKFLDPHTTNAFFYKIPIL